MIYLNTDIIGRKSPPRKERSSTDYHSSIIKTLIFMMQRAEFYERALHVRTYFSSLHQPDMNQTLDLCKWLQIYCTHKKNINLILKPNVVNNKKEEKGKRNIFSKTVISIRIISYHAYFVWGKKKKMMKDCFPDVCILT